VDPHVGWIVPLHQAAGVDEQAIGGKAAQLARLAEAGFRVPAGFFVTTRAYEHFVEQRDLTRLVRMELGRKPFASMRWEEIWDVALRIRSAFLSATIPESLAQAIGAAVEALGASRPLVVRSSAPGEDSAGRSFAGLHESVVDVVGTDDVLDAVRVVWASLWSDAALLYRQELALDPALSHMAVVVQELIDRDRSGVAFGRDPRQPARDHASNHAIIEAVPGPCSDLVDGLVDPDRWIMDRATGQVVEWRAGQREETQAEGPILESQDLHNLHRMLLQVESLFNWAPDTEWTGQGDHFTLLQARPITTATPPEDDPRGWYLSLRPGRQRLGNLARRVSHELIPQLEELGRRFAKEDIETLNDRELAVAIHERHAALKQWQQTYRDDFIPFAHGVRQLGTYYNDAVKPEDPYEFVGLLQGQQMVASRRNQALQALAGQIQENPSLRDGLLQAAERGWQNPLPALQAVPGGPAFVEALNSLQTQFLDVAYSGQRLSDHPELLLPTLLEMSQSSQPTPAPPPRDQGVQALEQRLLQAVGPQREEEARQVLNIGRLSWRLRDDDNLLVGRLESQLLRALELAAARLQAAGRLAAGAPVTIPAAPALAAALQDPSSTPVTLPDPPPEIAADSAATGESPRQLVGQPASPGLATGPVRRVQDTQDLARFRAGEVLVCDAIQPTMTHLVPLASAIVERRGGMLIHGAIIARELGIPCVNGIPHAVQHLEDGQIVTVDGYLGIVTVGAPEFVLEGV
jgi:pyruvate,water dikinase